MNQSGTMLGNVDTEGNIFNVSGSKMGMVEPAGEIYLMVGAARLLILK